MSTSYENKYITRHKKLLAYYFFSIGATVQYCLYVYQLLSCWHLTKLFPFFLSIFLKEGWFKWLMATYGCSTCPLTLLYKLWMDMFLWYTKTCGCVQACVCYWTLSACDQNSFCVYLSRACVRYFHSMTYAWKTHMSASAGHACEWHMNTVFTTRACVCEFIHRG